MDDSVVGYDEGPTVIPSRLSAPFSSAIIPSRFFKRFLICYPHMTYAELELTLRAQDDGYVADLRFRAPDSAADSDLALGVPVALDPPGLRVLSTDWSAYGRTLTTHLFADPRMREAWATVRGFLQGANAPLRLRLRIAPGADEIHALRWELLQDPATGTSLCRSQRVLFARSLDTTAVASVTTTARANLRALITIANPRNLVDYTLAPVDVAGELARARAALGDLPTTLLAGSPHGPGATLEALSSALRGGYPLLTLVCHGSMTKDGPILWLERDDGMCDMVPGETLVQRIADLDPDRRPLLIILASCQTAGRDQNADMLAALGPQLARAGVGAVIGMQGNVPMATIELLLPRLLAHLREDGQIDRALALARAALPDDQPWWMPVLFMRVRDGRLWNDDLLPPSPTTPPPDGFARLAHPFHDPHVRDELAEFRAIFSAARDQIGVLNRYKELHDTLQELERPFTVVARDRRRVADDPTAWDDLDPQIADLQGFARVALAMMTDPLLADESAWGIQQLHLAGADLDLAQTQSDVRRLDVAMGRYKRVLARELPRADNRLAACAGDLRLAQVTQALGHVQAGLREVAPDLGAIHELATWIATFDSLHAHVTGLVSEHHRWQVVDNELRRVAESMTGDPIDLELAWGDLLLQTTPLFGGVTDEWAAALNTLGAQIGQALAEGAIPQARRHFISYQSRARRRFVEVDKALLTTCNELRGAGDALGLILRTLDEG